MRLTSKTIKVLQELIDKAEVSSAKFKDILLLKKLKENITDLKDEIIEIESSPIFKEINNIKNRYIVNLDQY